MLHSVVCPSRGHAIVNHFGEGAAVWGQVITPSIAPVGVESHAASIAEIDCRRPTTLLNRLAVIDSQR